jgi:signal transduction histidine kinase
MPKSLFIDKPKLSPSLALIPTHKVVLKENSISTTTRRRVKDRPIPPTELITALQTQLRSFETEIGLSTELVSNITHCTLSATYLSALLLITSEALNNIRLHAHATSVLMFVYLHDHNLRLEIIDNGIGMKPNKIYQSDSDGISRMHTAAIQLGGSLSIAASPGKGTLLTLTTITEK